MRLIVHVALTLVCLTLSCKQGSGNQSGVPAYDSTTNTMVIPDHQLSYSIPAPENSIIASKQELPDNILMCVVDTASQISVLLIELDTPVTDRMSATDVVNRITVQPADIHVIIKKNSLSNCRYLGHESWRFDKTIGVISNGDTINVTYRGYIFGQLAITATIPSDSVGSNDIDKYFERLRRIQ